MRLRRHWFTGVISLVVIVFLWAPLVIVAINSVNSDTLLVSWKGFTTHWYNQAYHNADVRSGVKQTMIIALLSTMRWPMPRAPVSHSDSMAASTAFGAAIRMPANMCGNEKGRRT